jgi:hypothetical protein
MPRQEPAVFSRRRQGLVARAVARQRRGMLGGMG